MADIGELPQAAGGECIALLGPGGAARRALLVSIAAERRERCLLVSGGDPLFARLDVEANVGFPLLARRMKRQERSRGARDLLALAGLDGAARRAVGQLDPELRARVLRARAFAASQALVLDDPFGGVSADERPSLHLMLRRLIRHTGTAVVLATADRSELFACGDRIGVWEPGHLPRIGDVASMLAAPGSAVAARRLLDAELFAGRVSIDPDVDEAEVHLACGAIMPARLSEGVGPGDLCLVAVRPDQIAFAAVRSADMGGRAMPATLIETRHLGDYTRLRLRLEDGSQTSIRRPAWSLTALDINRASQPLGASLAWRSSQATAYPHPQA